MIKAYFFKNFLKYSFSNILGFIIYCIFFLIYKYLIGFQPINGALNIFLFLVIIVLLVFQSIYGYLIYAPSTKLFINKSGIEIKEKFKDQYLVEWHIIERISLKSENINLQNMYIELKDGKELRFILKKNWLFSILTKYSLRSNLADFEKLMKDTLQFKSKFSLVNFNEIKKLIN